MTFRRISQALLLAPTLAFGTTVSAAQVLATSECVVRPHSTIELSSATPGILESVAYERSDEVRAGEVIARLESEVERMDVEVAAARAHMESDIGLSEESLAYDERNQKRLAELRRTRAVAELEHDRASRDSRLSRLKLRKARELNSLRKLQLARAEAVLRRRAIVSPVDGFILERHKSPGEFVEDEPIVTVVQLNPLRVEAVFPLAAFSHIRRGDAAVVTVETGGEKTYPATVSVVDRVADAASGTLSVRLEMSNPDYAVPAGIKCQVKVEPLSQHAATNLPQSGRALTTVIAAPAPSSKLAPTAMQHRPSAAVSERCEAYGPVESATDAADVLRRIQDLAKDARVQSRAVKLPTGYAVTADAPEAASATRTLIKSLRARGIEDVAVTRRAGGSTEISFGFYASETRAKARVSALHALDVQARVTARHSQQARWWIELDSRSADEYVRAQLRPLKLDPTFDCATRGLVAAGR